MSTGEKKSKDKFARHVHSIEAIFERREKIGTTLTSAQRALLEEVAARDLLWYRYGYHALRNHEALPKGMDHTQRQTKAALLEKLRSCLSDLALLAEASGPKLEDVERSVPKGGRTRFRPWISRFDLLDVLDLEDLCIVVGFAADVFGEDYAKALIGTIESYHKGRDSKEPSR